MANATVPTQAFLDQTAVSPLRTTCITFLVLNCFFLAVRLLSRYYQHGPFGWDDVLLGFGWLFTIGLCIDGIIAPRFGVGIRFEKVLLTMPEQIPNWGKNGFYAIPIIYSVAVVLPKMSVLVLYLRVFVDKRSKICCWILFAMLALSAIINIFTTGFQCNKLEAAWNLELDGGHCNDIQAHLTYSTVPNIVTDLAMLLLPIPVVRKLQVALYVKIAVAVTFLIASFGLITAIIRFVQFFVFPYAEDPTYNAAQLIIWVVVETSVYFISACLLCCRPILSKLIQNPAVVSMYSWLRRSTTRTGASNSRSRDDFGQRQDSSDNDLVLSKKSSQHQGEDTLYDTVDNYPLKPVTQSSIHVRHDFGMTTNHSAV